MNIEDLKNQILEESIRTKGTIDYEYSFARLIDILIEYFPHYDEKDIIS